MSSLTPLGRKSVSARESKPNITNYVILLYLQIKQNAFLLYLTAEHTFLIHPNRIGENQYKQLMDNKTEEMLGRKNIVRVVKSTKMKRNK